MDSPTGINKDPLLPGRQVALVLAGFPALYVLNSFMPWSTRLFGQHDRSAWIPFMLSVLCLHWASALAVIALVRKAGGSAADLGLRISPRKGALLFLGGIAYGAAMVLWRESLPHSPGSAEHYPAWLLVFYPHNLEERCLWVVVSLSAGICEELVYRGFGITALERRGLRRWAAVGLASAAFVFVHGLAGLFAFPVYFLTGLLFSWLYLWRKSLVPGMVVHALFDLNAVFAL